MSSVEDVRTALMVVKEEIDRARVSTLRARRLAEEAHAITTALDVDHPERITPPEAELALADLDRALETLAESEQAVDAVLSSL